MIEPKKDDLSALAALSAKKASGDEAAKQVDVTTTTKEYQQYTSARISTCLITPTGKRINFTNYEYYTKDKEIITFLDEELENGCRAFVKGQLLSVDDINPAAAAKRKIIEDFKASQDGRDFSMKGQQEALAAAGKSGGAGTGSVSTEGVAN
jgi:hypothetical protein